MLLFSCCGWKHNQSNYIFFYLLVYATYKTEMIGGDPRLWQTPPILPCSFFNIQRWWTKSGKIRIIRTAGNWHLYCEKPEKKYLVQWSLWFNKTKQKACYFLTHVHVYKHIYTYMCVLISQKLLMSMNFMWDKEEDNSKKTREKKTKRWLADQWKKRKPILEKRRIKKQKSKSYNK